MIKNYKQVIKIKNQISFICIALYHNKVISRSRAGLDYALATTSNHYSLAQVVITTCSYFTSKTINLTSHNYQEFHSL